LRLPSPFQPILTFYDGMFCRCTNFFPSRTSKFRHSAEKKRQLLGTTPRPLPFAHSTVLASVNLMYVGSYVRYIGPT